MKHDATVSNVDSEIGREIGVPVDPVNEQVLEWHAAMLQVLGINNIGQLRDELVRNQTLLVRYAKALTSESLSWHGPIHSFAGAISLMYLISIRATESEDPNVVKKVFGAMQRGNETTEDTIAEVKRVLFAAASIELSGGT